MDRALGLIQSAEEEEMKSQEKDEKKEEEKDESSKTAVATTSSPSKEISVHRVVPDSKLLDRGNHVQAMIRVPCENLDDIRFHYVVDENSASLTVCGRQHNSDKQTEEFEVKFNLPQNVDVSKARAKVHGDNLCVTIPKRAPEQQLISTIAPLHLSDFFPAHSLSPIYSPFYHQPSYSPCSRSHGRSLFDDDWPFSSPFTPF